MRRALPIFLCVVLSVLSACQRAVTPLPHEAYVWQRQWTPALRDALRDAAPTFAGWRVLAAETDRSGTSIATTPDLDALAQQNAARITAVLRIDGSTPAFDASAIAARALQIVQRWRAAGIALNAIEIDHDCARSGLADYARGLSALRAQLPPDVRLSITALPDWIQAPALSDVLAQVDESVLQVHAVRSPAENLFDAQLALRWIDTYAARSPRPFRVALPAYGVGVRFDEAGRALAVEAETPRADLGSDVREIAAQPADVAWLLRRLEAAPPPRLAGIAWFRLPTAQDRRAWSLAALRAVISGAPLAHDLSARVVMGADGAQDLLLSNRGALDAPLPASVAVQASACSAADGVNDFVAQPGAHGWRFVAAASTPLRAGHERRIGWLRCGIVEKVNLDEAR